MSLSHILDAVEERQAEEQRRATLVERICQYEAGVLDMDGVVSLFQHLIDTGLAWSLQGSYGRTAVALIDEGYCTTPQLRREYEATQAATYLQEQDEIMDGGDDE